MGQTHKGFSTGMTLLIAVCCGYLFMLIHLPIPWLLGPMIGVCLASRWMKPGRLYWPGYVRNTGLIIIGFAIGLSFTKDTGLEIVRQLPSMVLMTILLLLFCLLIAYGLTKLAGISFSTALTGSIPGGLTQMITLAEETKGIDLTVVAFLQVSRLMMIVIAVPLLIFSPLFGSAAVEELASAVSTGAAGGGGLFPEGLVYAAACTGCALLGKRVHFPTTFLLAPLLVTAVLHLSGVAAPELPSFLLAAAQLMVGCYVGLLLKPETLPNKMQIITLSAASGIVLVLGACGLSYLLTLLHPMSSATSLLSLSPGGMDQMGIIAHEIQADVSIVTCYQLFRTFFIFFAVPPLLRWLFRRMASTGSSG